MVSANPPESGAMTTTANAAPTRNVNKQSAHFCIEIPKNLLYFRRVFESLIGLFSSDLAIDLGTANIVVYHRGRGVTINEPSVVAIRNDGTGERRVIAVGHEAKEMIGKTPDAITAIRPIKDGVIADFSTTEAMLKYFIAKAHNRKTLIRPRIIICIPSGVTEVERRAVEESAMSAGAREVYLVEEPVAAAVGADMPIMEPSGNMVVDAGGGTTEVAVISLGGIVISKSVRIAGDKMDEAIITYLKKKYSLLIGEKTAEQLKITVGEAYPSEQAISMDVKGRDLVRGVPRTIKVTAPEIREALQEPVRAIVDAVKVTLERCPPELAADIYDRGIVLTGGTALLRNLDQLIAKETGLPVQKAEDPLLCVVLGSGKILENFEAMKKLLVHR
jgi:rod shape-determining protein MreB and related proteins